jgi:hypothetical protein
MTKEQALERLAALDGFDKEHDHVEADFILCDLLVSLGFEDVVEAFEAIDKWYA